MLLIMLSCKQEEKVVLKEDFVFGYGGMENLKVFKFTDDTVYISKNYPSRLKAHYYIINDYDITKINKFLSAIENVNYNKEYINDNVVDGLYYQFEFLKTKKRVYVQNYESIDLIILTQFADYLINLSNFKEEVEHFNIKIDFGNTAVFFRHAEPCFLE